MRCSLDGRLASFARAARIAVIAGTFALGFASASWAARPAVQNPHGDFREECGLCHGAQGWKPAKVATRFDHGKYGFQLEGAHAAAGCMNCHTTLQFSQSKTQCQSCHEDPHRGEMGLECARCHGAKSFTDRAPMVRAHQLTRFPLSGGHASVDCESCHRPQAQGRMQFVNTRTDCQSCHMDRYRATRDPDHAASGFPVTCQGCHSTESWNTAKFDHDRTTFPLTGRHRGTTCTSCHSNGQFASTSTACQSCHQAQYDTAQPPHASAGFAATACASCHNTNSFAGAAFNHNSTSFPLTGAHTAASCTNCHSSGVYDGLNTACQSCHATDYSSAPINHAAAGFAANACATCHSTTRWAGATFNHGTTSFPLTGSHTTATCQGCHTGTVFNNLSTACQSCHMVQYNAATPPHASSGFAASACATCHNTTSFSGATFNHGNTSFPLTGAHQAASCNSCHASGVYDGLNTACQSCHATDYSAAPLNHSAAGFAASACATCHNTSRWTGATYNHAATSFPLTGSHTSATCRSCHTGTVFNNLSTTCQSCHMVEYNAATPPHAASGFAAAACATCHNTTSFAGATFNHNNTSFPLTGAHLAQSCTRCHSSGVYDGLNTACQSCHATDYGAAPFSHSAAGFAASACATCHNTTAWLEATYNHNATSFPLTGSHTTATCQGCHTGAVFNNLAMDCASCHMVQYNAATPPHASSGFAASACATCHNTTSFSGATFNHSNTSFPLTGAHQAAACNTCHSGGVYDGLNTTCQSCHATDYSSAPVNHTAAGFAASACATCHSTTSWNGATYNHGATSFPLTGSHTTATCQSCHTGTVFNNLATDCASCHMVQYNAATPPHASSGFAASACATCHNTTSFSGATFNHSNTSFPLTGAHQAAACNTCHSSGVYDGLNTACQSCHQADFNGATLNHTAAGFAASACATCHTTTQWAGGTYNHGTTSFPLTGSHTTVACRSCHTGTVFNNLPATCQSCHMTDYNSAVPNHVSAGFAASACATCHTTTQWSGATFNHDTSFFPIYSGRHRSVWGTNCATCHTNSANYAVFTCIDCHEHNQTDMNRKHQGRSGYSWDSAACYRCHPRGNS